MSGQQPTVYGERYEVERLLASGSMGDVFVARHKLTGQRVALKVLFPNVARNVGGVERFLTEIRAASSIEHEGVIRIFDAGEDNGTFYYAMELLDGQTLDDWLHGEEKPLGLALSLVYQMLGALAQAHQKGIIHRDIKPENIFVTRKSDGTLGIKLLDFGIARDLQGNRMTQTGYTLGTPMYMSPEQATSPQSLTPASDVWSVGVMLYEIVTGQTPFDAETPQAICIRSLCDEHTPVSQLVPKVPPELEALIDRCLDKEPINRPANGAELQGSLGHVLETLAGSSLVMARQAPLAYQDTAASLASMASAAKALRASSSGAALLAPPPPPPPKLGSHPDVDPNKPVTATFSPVSGAPSYIVLDEEPIGAPLRKQTSRGWLPVAAALLLIAGVAGAWVMRPAVESQAKVGLETLNKPAQPMAAALPTLPLPEAAVAAPTPADTKPAPAAAPVVAETDKVPEVKETAARPQSPSAAPRDGATRQVDVVPTQALTRRPSPAAAEPAQPKPAKADPAPAAAKPADTAIEAEPKLVEGSEKAEGAGAQAPDAQGPKSDSAAEPTIPAEMAAKDKPKDKPKDEPKEEPKEEPKDKTDDQPSTTNKPKPPSKPPAVAPKAPANDSPKDDEGKKDKSADQPFVTF